MSEEIKLIERQYQRVIDVRDKLIANYTTWVNFYYVILTAVYFGYGFVINSNEKSEIRNFTPILSFLGFYVSLVWNLSCRGYNYYSNHFMLVIKDLEKELLKECNSNEKHQVFNRFSTKIAMSEKKGLFSWKYANVSTPKLNIVTTWVALLITYFIFIHELVQCFEITANSPSIIYFASFLILVLIQILCSRISVLKSGNIKIDEGSDFTSFED